MTKSRVFVVGVCLLILISGAFVLGQQLGRGTISLPLLQSQHPGISECGNTQPVARPTAITLTCADAGTVAHDIHWRFWGGTLAGGSATVTQNNCQPSCAEGTYIDYAAALLADQVYVTDGGPQFTRLVLVFGDSSPMSDPDQETETLKLETY